VYIGDGVDGIINSAETADTARHGLKGGGALLTRRSVGADLDGCRRHVFAGTCDAASWWIGLSSLLRLHTVVW
jgi:hypothetical protein